jgi:hypothetical protein
MQLSNFCPDVLKILLAAVVGGGWCFADVKFSFDGNLNINLK